MKKKFSYAWQGIATGLKHKSIRIQFILAAMAMLAGIIMRLKPMEWAAVIICIGAVITAEMLNTCIEKICDFITKDYREEIKVIKDIAAGAVLVTSLAALITALIILACHLGMLS